MVARLCCAAHAVRIVDTRMSDRTGQIGRWRQASRGTSLLAAPIATSAAWDVINTRDRGIFWSARSGSHDSISRISA